MADGVFNISKGSFVEKIRDSATPVDVLLLQSTGIEADATLVDHDTVQAMLASTNTEATFTNYAREEDATGATILIDDTNDWVDVDLDDITWTSAGNGTNNTLAKLITCYDEGGTDGTRIPMTHHDFSVTTDGSDITAQVNTEGFGRAA